MIRVLQVYPQMNNAGTERVIMNLHANIDRSYVQFDYLTEQEGEMDDTLRIMGSKIHQIKSKNRWCYFCDLIRFFKTHPEYRIVHTHTHAWMDVVLLAAKTCRIPCRIAHSHNARNDLSRLMAYIKGITSIPMELAATHFFACSKNAAQWLFPHKKQHWKVIPNAISLSDYLYSPEKRCHIRRSLNITGDEFVMIHVGRFAKQKNHTFILSILEAFNQQQKNWKMIFVGTGPLETEIKQQSEKAGLSEHLLFLGNRRDVCDLLSAADCFLFPSLHEGLGIVVIEAQAAALPCIVSEAVPTEANLNLGLLHTLSLEQSPSIWADTIKSASAPIHRSGLNNEILNSEYNIIKVATSIQQFYSKQAL